MSYRCTPVTQPFNATVRVPGSKSVANRALICAALADGSSVLRNIPNGNDSEALLSGLASLGLEVSRSDGEVTIRSTQPLGEASVHAGLAGTTSRFLTALAATGTSPIIVDGADRLRARPIAPLLVALRQLGADISDTDGRLPVRIRGPLTGHSVEIDASTSSQFISALMMIGPTLPDGLTLTLSGDVVSQPYLDLTASVMQMFGVNTSIEGNVVEVQRGRYQALDLFIEADASSASYPLAIAAVTGSTVTIDGFGADSHQGDARIVEILASMGAEADTSPNSVTLSGDSSMELRGIDIDMAEISDLVPTVAAVATLASSPTRIRNVGFIREKESDRIGDLAKELSKCGADVVVHDDGLEISPADLHGAALDTHEDHRLAMAFSILGSRVSGVEILGPDVVAKSWPSFWTDLEQMINET